MLFASGVWVTVLESLVTLSLGVSGSLLSHPERTKKCRGLWDNKKPNQNKTTVIKSRKIMSWRPVLATASSRPAWVTK